MEQIGALTPAGLEPILKRFFVPLLRRKHVLRIMDIYTGEGIHALLRIGTTLCCLSHAHLGETVRENCDNAAVFWYGVKRFAHSKHFHFDLFLEHQGAKTSPPSPLNWPKTPLADYIWPSGFHPYYNLQNWSLFTPRIIMVDQWKCSTDVVPAPNTQ
eukprot:scaffold159870_cov24-Cyclotella_meneghiniana.AAC.1